MNRLLQLLLLIFLGGSTAWAQQQIHRFYELSAPVDRAQVKNILIAIQDLDPNALVFESDDLMVLQVKANASVPDQELRSAISSTGLTVLAGHPDPTKLYGEAPEVPMYMDTGDPFNDHKRYTEAVDAYNAAHPDSPMPQPIPYYED